MPDEYTICAAAFFRCKGANIVTRDEFTMNISMDRHWMNYKSAETLLETLLSKGILTKSGDFIKPAFDISDIDVPVAYKPSEEFVKSLSHTTATAAKEPTPAKEGRVTAGNLLPMMIQEATETGMEKRDFISEANSISKRLNIDMLVAGLLILRDRDVDIDSLADCVYDSVTKK